MEKLQIRGIFDFSKFLLYKRVFKRIKGLLFYCSIIFFLNVTCTSSLDRLLNEICYFFANSDLSRCHLSHTNNYHYSISASLKSFYDRAIIRTVFMIVPSSEQFLWSCLVNVLPAILLLFCFWLNRFAQNVCDLNKMTSIQSDTPRAS